MWALVRMRLPSMTMPEPLTLTGFCLVHGRTRSGSRRVVGIFTTRSRTESCASAAVAINSSARSAAKTKALASDNMVKDSISKPVTCHYCTKRSVKHFALERLFQLRFRRPKIDRRERTDRIVVAAPELLLGDAGDGGRRRRITGAERRKRLRSQRLLHDSFIGYDRVADEEAARGADPTPRGVENRHKRRDDIVAHALEARSLAAKQRGVDLFLPRVEKRADEALVVVDARRDGVERRHADDRRVRSVDEPLDGREPDAKPGEGALSERDRESADVGQGDIRFAQQIVDQRKQDRGVIAARGPGAVAAGAARGLAHDPTLFNERGARGGRSEEQTSELPSRGLIS